MRIIAARAQSLLERLCAKIDRYVGHMIGPRPKDLDQSLDLFRLRGGVVHFKDFDAALSALTRYARES